MTTTNEETIVPCPGQLSLLDPEPAEHVHDWGSTGGAWRCSGCHAMKPRIIGPGV